MTYFEFSWHHTVTELQFLTAPHFLRDRDKRFSPSLFTTISLNLSAVKGWNFGIHIRFQDLEYLYFLSDPVGAILHVLLGPLD